MSFALLLDGLDVRAGRLLRFQFTVRSLQPSADVGHVGKELAPLPASVDPGGEETGRVRQINKASFLKVFNVIYFISMIIAIPYFISTFVVY